ncbi:MAG: DUF2764 family protein [Bacteroidales bacterium]|nr:DUF2764 family protein [Bacteroidales bacterium]MDP2236745.1 DUF2764 family protein [Bacteroidales bacterium]
MLLNSKRAYYYLVAGLPDLLLDEGKIKTTMADIREELLGNLHPDDLTLARVLFLKYDNANLLNILLKNFSEFDERGIYPLSLMEEQIKEPGTGILPYLSEFITEFKSEDQEVNPKSWENRLEEKFYAYLLSLENDFIRQWYELQLNMGNVLTAINCRYHKIAPELQLIGNNAIVESIMRSNAKDFGLTQEFPEIETILSAWETNDVLSREKVLDTIRWNWIDENVFFHYFTIEKLIAFLLQLEMVERWMKLDYEEGKRLFVKLLDKLGSSYELPEEFTPQHLKT